MEPKILFEDDSILLIDKPAGWIVNEAVTTGMTPVLQSWISKNFDFETSKVLGFRSGIVHRLDKETSGVLIIAKTSYAFENLQKQFKERRIKKSYLALAHGRVGSRRGVIEVPVGRLPWRRDRFGVLPGGRASLTEYTLIDLYKKESEYFSLVSLNPKTGRTHQIRIHLKYLGHPIVSDDFYAGRKTSRKDRVWCPRLFLHAAKIEFTHPATSEKLSFTSDLPPDLEKVLHQLEKIPQTP
jgi:23S rRNA pseudouridine1911/1915/1917 synthase